ncbi:ABC transporter substrate-binding protein [Tomitella biformata]|uniref:ABC transporter substrate-binding protein n=1 Tax=Tomitella biformata TaxID=630403 RepID=UPI0006856ABB|nr:ABC transporter substrate-binding protein [Tomitella biformata]
MATIAMMASAALLAGCASSSSSGSDDGSGGATTSPGTVGIIGDQPAGGSPVDGGTLSFAPFAPVASLDPTRTIAAGASGGSQMAAIYDVLMRWDSGTEKYVPQLAESFTSSDDHLSWTLKLRDGIKFSDGTELNADAVVSSTNRYNQNRGSGSEVFQAGVQSVEATDPSTVVYTLKQPWPEFPSQLSFGYGMIVAPSSDGPDNAFTPIGAGPFTLTKLTPGTELLLTARADYWNGAPHLAELKFVDILGDQPKIDAMKAGGIHMAYLRNADSVDTAKADFPGYIETDSMMDFGAVNSREGHPGADVRVRKAMALAIDPDVMNERGRDGKGIPGTAMFLDWSKWHNDVAGITPNLDEARALVEEVQAEGLDTHIKIVSAQVPASQAMALVEQSMLQSAGFTADIEYVANFTDLLKTLFVTYDFDLALSGTPVPDAAPFGRLFSILNSTSSTNSGGYADPKMDQLLEDVKSAITDDEKRTALAAVQTEVNEKAPILAWGAGTNFVPWTNNVHGVVPSQDGIVLFDKAWIE